MPKSNTRPDRADVYTRITAEIIAAIEAGAGKYRMPWHHDGSAIARPVNLASGKRYRGVNTVALWVAASSAGYGQGLWGTYRQWQAAGAQVRKGERATTVVLWKEFVSSEEKDEESDDSSHRPKLFARAFSVFNVNQVDNYRSEPLPILPESERLAHADAFIGNLDIATVFGGSEAYYRPSNDTVYMPPFAHFKDAAGFYGVWSHECGHASGAKHRLDRDLTGRFGSAAYALEEITVEILAGYVLADLGIAHHPRPDHAAYVSSWLTILKNDPRAIFTAASKAQEAADWMHARQSAAPAFTTQSENSDRDASSAPDDSAGMFLQPEIVPGAAAQSLARLQRVLSHRGRAAGREDQRVRGPRGDL